MEKHGEGKPYLIKIKVINCFPTQRVGDKGAYIGAVIDALSPTVAPVIVSPSMSGGFVVPFLADSPEKVRIGMA